MPDGYVISTTNGRESIRCLACGSVSYNWGDIVNHYCGVCHVFHDDPRHDVDA